MNTRYDRSLMSRNSKTSIGLTSKIRRQFSSLPTGQMLSTRQLLCLNAKRSTLDMTLHRMVKSGEIQRLAREVFRKASMLPFPSAEEIGRFKAKAFHREAFMHGADAALYLGFAANRNADLAFVTDAATTSFMTVSGRVTLIKVSPRKLLKGDGTIALLVRAGTNMGKDSFIVKDLPEPQQLKGNRDERLQLRRCADLMPAWMSDQFVSKEFRSKSEIDWKRLEQEYYPYLSEKMPGVRELPTVDYLYLVA